MVLRADKIRVVEARLGFAPEVVGTHSLRSGGAMAMYITRVPDRMIMFIGRCHSLGSMVYIQQQISYFSEIVSVCMSQQP